LTSSVVAPAESSVSGSTAHDAFSMNSPGIAANVAEPKSTEIIRINDSSMPIQTSTHGYGVGIDA
jgi:hypothetical protein